MVSGDTLSQKIQAKKKSMLPEKMDPQYMEKKMAARAAKIRSETPQSSEEIRQEAFDEITKNYSVNSLNIAEGSSPTCTVEMPKNTPITESLFNPDISIISDSKLTLKTKFTTEDALKMLKRDPMLLSSLSQYQGPMFTVNKSEELQKQLKPIPFAEKPVYAASVFLHGRRRTITEIGEKLNQTYFPSVTIQQIVGRSQITSEFTAIQFFTSLSKENLISQFFMELNNLREFKRFSYFTDAIVCCPDLCTSLAPFFDVDVKYINSIPDPRPTPLPLAHFSTPYLRIAQTIPHFINQRTKNWMMHSDTAHNWLSPLATILMSIICFLAGGMYEIGRGNFNSLLSLFDKMTVSPEDKSDLGSINSQKIPTEDKVVGLLITKMANKNISRWLIGAIPLLMNRTEITVMNEEQRMRVLYESERKLNRLKTFRDKFYIFWDRNLPARRLLSYHCIISGQNTCPLIILGHFYYILGQPIINHYQKSAF